MKKIRILCFVFALTLAFSACSFTKTAITTREFSSKAESLGFVVEDATDQMGGQTIASIVAIDSTASFQIEFHQVETRSQASGAFSENSSNFDRVASGTTVSANGANWASYAKTAGGTYYYVSYIDNTFVYVRTAEENKQAIKDFIKAIGY
jgi:hypothetical protein